MDESEFIKQVSSVESASAKVAGDFMLEVGNSRNNYTVLFDVRNVASTQFVISPYNQSCLQVNFNQGGIIITPDDFVFDVPQDEFINVSNLPGLVSIREMIHGLQQYFINPNPNGNIDLNSGLYFSHYYIVKSAFRKGFLVDMYVQRLKEIGEENDFWGLGPLELFNP